MHADFIHHNAYYKGDRASLSLAMKEKAIEFPEKKYQILRAVEDGAFVAVHASCGRGYADFGNSDIGPGKTHIRDYFGRRSVSRSKIGISIFS